MKVAALIGALSISLYTIFLFSCTFTPAQTHHVIFEEIGEMASTLSYIPVIIPINISGLLHAIDDFRGKVVALKTKYTDKAKYASRLDKYGGSSPIDPTKACSPPFPLTTFQAHGSDDHRRRQPSQQHLKLEDIFTSS